MCCMEHIDVTVLRLFFRIEESSGLPVDMEVLLLHAVLLFLLILGSFFRPDRSLLLFADSVIFSCQNIMIPAYYMRSADGLASWK